MEGGVAKYLKQLLNAVLIHKAFRFTLPKPNLLGPKQGKFSKLSKFRWISVYRFLFTLVPVSNGANMFIRYLKIIVDLLIQYSATQLDLLAPGQMCKSVPDMGGGFRVITFWWARHGYTIIYKLCLLKRVLNRLKQGVCIKTCTVLKYSSYGFKAI